MSSKFSMPPDAIARMNMLLGRRVPTPTQGQPQAGPNGSKVLAKEGKAEPGSVEMRDEPTPSKAKA